MDLLKALYDWLNSLDGAVAAVVGGILLAFIAGIWKFVLAPGFKWLLLRVGKLLYPIASGAFFFDRYLALPRYLKTIKLTVGRLRNPWLIEGQELKDIFVPLSAKSRNYGSQTYELKQVCQSNRSAIFIGGPGSGKTTALKSIAVDCINQRFTESKKKEYDKYVPVFIELRQLMSLNLSLEDFVVKTFQDNGFPRPQRIIKNLRKSGHLVFLLDALDEVDNKEKRKRILQDIRNLLQIEERSVKPCHIFITSRPTGYQGQLSDVVAKTFYMADFNPAQMSKFIYNWDFRPPKSQEKLINVIMERPPILEICRNPLMLTIVTSLYRETDYTLPDSREDFYKICIDALLKRWDAVKELESRNKYPPSLKEAFLQGLAFDLISDWSQTYNLPLIREEVEKFLKERNKNDIDPDSFLEEIIRSGLLGRLNTGEIFFAHKTFAEALTSSYLRNQPHILIDCWNKNPDAWMEVCSLYVADPLTDIKDINKLIDNAKKKEDWSSILILAGEAHTISEQQLDWIKKNFLAKTELWSKLNRRAITAISRLKQVSRQILTKMLETGSNYVRQEAMYALGYLDEQWTVELITKYLVDESLQETAITSLAALGDRGVPIIRELIKNNKNNSLTLLLACIKVVENIGSYLATNNIIPLIWHEEMNVRFNSTKVVMAKLKNEEYRRSFESNYSSLYYPNDARNEIYELAKWALPRVQNKSEALELNYCAMIYNMAKNIYSNKNISWEDYELIPEDLLIPIIFYVTREQGRQKSENWNIQQVLGTNENQPNKIEQIINQTKIRTYEKNRKLWTRARGQYKSDIEITYNNVNIVGFIILLLGTIPLAAAIIIDRLSIWWLISYLLFISVSISITIREQDLKLLYKVLCVIGLLPGLFSNFSKIPKLSILDIILLLICFLSILVPGIYSTIFLGNYWLLCFIPWAIQPFLPEVTNNRIVFWRRSNPLLSLLERISTTE